MKSTVDRRDKILQRIQSKGSVRVDELSEEFDVSTVTIRNDLDFFEEKGLIHRTYGGALLLNNIYKDPSIEEKRKINIEEKRRIAKYAGEMIKDGESIILDSGSTTREIATQLKGQTNITLMTNSINIALELVAEDELEILLTGGVLREKSYSLVGPEAEHAMQNYFFDKLFLGVDGMVIDHGLTTSIPPEVNLDKLIVQSSTTVIAVSNQS